MSYPYHNWETSRKIGVVSGFVTCDKALAELGTLTPCCYNCTQVYFDTELLTMTWLSTTSKDYFD
jgi:hypothetical protein